MRSKLHAQLFAVKYQDFSAQITHVTELGDPEMVFRDYVQLLYKAYLEDQGVISKLRDKVKDPSYLQDLNDDPGLIIGKCCQKADQVSSKQD